MPRNYGTPTSRMIGLFMGMGNAERQSALDALKAIQTHTAVPHTGPGATIGSKPVQKRKRRTKAELAAAAPTGA